MGRPPIHPGEILAEELETLHVRPAQLARMLDVPANRVTQILKGERAITADTALRLARWSGTSPEFWMNLQTAYDLRRTEQEQGAAIAGRVQHYEPGSVSAL